MAAFKIRKAAFPKLLVCMICSWMLVSVGAGPGQATGRAMVVAVLAGGWVVLVVREEVEVVVVVGVDVGALASTVRPPSDMLLLLLLLVSVVAVVVVVLVPVAHVFGRVLRQGRTGQKRKELRWHKGRGMSKPGR